MRLVRLKKTDADPEPEQNEELQPDPELEIEESEEQVKEGEPEDEAGESETEKGGEESSDLMLELQKEIGELAEAVNGGNIAMVAKEGLEAVAILTQIIQAACCNSDVQDVADIFKSKAQQGYLFTHEPKVAKEFASKTPASAYKKLPEHIKDEIDWKPADAKSKSFWAKAKEVLKPGQQPVKPTANIAKTLNDLAAKLHEFLEGSAMEPAEKQKIERAFRYQFLSRRA